MDAKSTRSLEAIKAALEWSKQISTLAGAFVVLSGTFLEVYGRDPNDKNYLYVSWVAMVLCLVLGVAYLSMVVSHLQDMDKDLDAYSSPSVIAAIIQVGAFMVGLVAFLAFVWKNL